MLLENEDKLKQENEDFKCDSQKISKYIETDPYSYVSNLIIQFSEYLTKGRGVSQQGVNAFFLFLLTSGLLYKYTVFPQTAVELLQLYIVPLLFLFYFIIDLLKNIPCVNNWLMKVFKGSGFAYCAIIGDSISLYELENYLEYKAFNSQQLIDIVKHLIIKNQFSPKCQAKLMRNTALYDVKSINYIKDLLLEFEFTTQAVCVFLKKMEMRLENKYLDKLIEKYGESPSLLFSVGKFHKYKINESNPLYRLGYEFHYKRNPYDMIISLVSLVFLALIFTLFIICAIGLLLFFEGSKGDFRSRLDSAFSIICISAFICIAIFSYVNSLNETHFERSVKKYLLDKKDLDNNVIEDIINDLSFR